MKTKTLMAAAVAMNPNGNPTVRFRKSSFRAGRAA